MGRKGDVDELVSTAEIVERLNLASREAVRSWRKRFSDFPQPVARLAIGDVYLWGDIEEWARAAGQPTGHRSKARATAPPD